MVEPRTYKMSRKRILSGVCKRKAEKFFSLKEVLNCKCDKCPPPPSKEKVPMNT